MQRTAWWQRADHRRAGGVLGLPAPRQPVAGALAEDEIWRAGLRGRRRRRPDAARVRRARPTGRPTAPRATGGATARDFGAVRLIVVDSRCGRILDDRGRAMVGGDEARWIERATVHFGRGPPARGDLAAVAAAAGGARPGVVERGAAPAARGARMARRFGEKMREARGSRALGGFPGVVRLAGRRAGGRGGRAASGRPATICVLSGDVHHQYVAQAHWPSTVDSRVYQIVVSPVHHSVPPQPAHDLPGRLEPAAGAGDQHARPLGRRAGPAADLDQERRAVLRERAGAARLDGRSAEFTLWHAVSDADRADRLDTVTTLRL